MKAACLPSKGQSWWPLPSDAPSGLLLPEARRDGDGRAHPGRRQFPKHPRFSFCGQSRSRHCSWHSLCGLQETGVAALEGRHQGPRLVELQADPSRLALAVFPGQPLWRVRLSQGAWESEHKLDFQLAGLRVRNNQWVPVAQS